MSLSIKTESDMILSPNDVILIWVHFLNPDKKVRNAAGWAVACAKCDKKKNMNMFRRSMNDCIFRNVQKRQP
ncbi:hypothetical protein HMPREF9441_01494 [Paraprevotella clara YIT 11840]|uniref:Uncharacterized protein n=1 Tax=Paraprevotella clara YIT 11840 TaxID=762968 RepID=G5SQ58_9BACT|nr:hypothetical protein HMPREF9441_01494 [Paraprevotella clara YIT 11840]